MTPAQADLARRLVDLPGWEWRAGMVDSPPRGFAPFRITETRVDDRFDPPEQTVSRGQGFTRAANLGPPDLTDEATAGVLLGMLWRADPAAGWHVHGPPGLICVHNGDRSREFYGDTLGEAVAAALIAVGRCA